jgi:pimeloyl-ACP methyl ester carboxylesterase
MQLPYALLPFATRRTVATASLVCVHCSAGGGRGWAPLADRLEGRLDLVAPDLLGYGGAATWSRSPEPLSLADEVSHLERQIERRLGGRGGPFHLFGHSYGGAVAMHLAMRRPERVLSLVLYEPASFALLGGDPASDAAREIETVARAVQAEATTAPEAAAERFVDYWSGAGTWARTGTARREAIALRVGKVADEFEALFRDQTPPGRYQARLSMPVLLLGGTRSPRPVREVLDRLHELVPHAQRATIEGLGHMGPLEDPARLAELLGDWAERPRPPSTGCWGVAA